MKKVATSLLAALLCVSTSQTHAQEINPAAPNVESSSALLIGQKHKHAKRHEHADKLSHAEPYRDYVACFVALQPPYSTSGINVVGEKKDTVLIPSEMGGAPGMYVMTAQGVHFYAVPLRPHPKLQATVIELTTPGKSPVLISYDHKNLSAPFQMLSPEKLAKHVGAIPTAIGGEHGDLEDADFGAQVDFTNNLKEDLELRIATVDQALQQALKPSPEGSPRDADPDHFEEHLKACEPLKKRSSALYAQVQKEFARIQATRQSLSSIQNPNLPKNEERADSKEVSPSTASSSLQAAKPVTLGQESK